MLGSFIPIPERRWVIREVEGKRQRRVSPHVGRVEEVFNELVYCPTLPLDPNFSLEVLLVYAEEAQAVRWRGKRRTRYTVTERHLVKVVKSTVFEKPVDYLHLLPEMNGAFTTRQLSKVAGLRITLARRMVYCLAKMETNRGGRHGRKSEALSRQGVIMSYPKYLLFIFIIYVARAR